MANNKMLKVAVLISCVVGPVQAFLGISKQYMVDKIALRHCESRSFPNLSARTPRNARATIIATIAEPKSFMFGTADPDMKTKMREMLQESQSFICKSVENVDGKGKFRRDEWIREDGGFGITAVMADGNVWEKAGCNLAVVKGAMPYENFKPADDRLNHNGIDRSKGYKPGDKIPFTAIGLSSVMHPKNPHCPTMHFNYRYFETENGLWWFGGGTDITPAYLDKTDMKHFHGVYKNICDRHDPGFYPKFKKWADDYFVIKHRGETRGLGGIFFDDLNDRSPNAILAFSKECAMNVPKAYLPIIEKHKNDAFTEEQKRWQLIRRGRYVEFNLVYDRGTIFGLRTGLGRVESMLMTLPETARWEYDHHPAPGSPEAEILHAFQHPQEWV